MDATHENHAEMTEPPRGRRAAITSRTLLRGALAGLFVAAIATTAIGVQPDRADAFGTVESSILKQKPVHEKITRVLSCTSTQAPEQCFDPLSIAALAGQNGTFGAVGEPDNPLDGAPNPAARHCDDGDAGYGSPHSQDDAWNEIRACVDYFQRYMKFALDSAAGLVDANGAIVPSQTGITNAFGTPSCVFPDPNKGHTSKDSAKCNVLNGLGRALHAYEDFWSHSNWADIADPAREVGLKNPKGLATPAQPDFFAFPSAVPATYPEGLITGCDDSINPIRCNGRTGHSVLNKDNGDVDANTCVATAPKTPRGQIDTEGAQNFQRAVSGACGAALRAWTDLKAALVATYGEARATAMIRAITSDHPLTECTLSGQAAKALDPPVGNVSSARSVDITFSNNSSKALVCSAAILDGGEWSNYPADRIEPRSMTTWRTQSNGLATGTEGTAKLRVDGTDQIVTVYWNNPYIGSNSARCSVDPPLTCTVSPIKGNNASLVVTLSDG